jgi:uncharacterized protein (TIGR03083 family)
VRPSTIASTVSWLRDEGSLGQTGQMGTELDVWTAVATQRVAFAELIEGCSPSQLETRSLCSGWRVRDVAGHMIWVASQPRLGDAWRALGAVRPHRYVEREAIRCAHGSASGLAERLRTVAPSRKRAPGIKPIGYLADAIVHGLDVCAPLGFDPIETSGPAMTASLDHYLGHDSLTGGHTRTKGLRMECDDLEWSTGSGPVVSGPAHAVLAAAVGRRWFLTALSGPGLGELSART